MQFEICRPNIKANLAVQIIGLEGNRFIMRADSVIGSFFYIPALIPKLIRFNMNSNIKINHKAGRILNYIRNIIINLISFEIVKLDRRI